MTHRQRDPMELAEIMLQLEACGPVWDFPDCDVSLTHTEMYGLRSGSYEITYRIVLTPTGRKRPDKIQIDQVACALLEAVFEGMGKE